MYRSSSIGRYPPPQGPTTNISGGFDDSNLLSVPNPAGVEQEQTTTWRQSTVRHVRSSSSSRSERERKERFPSPTNASNTGIGGVGLTAPPYIPRTTTTGYSVVSGSATLRPPEIQTQRYSPISSSPTTSTTMQREQQQREPGAPPRGPLSQLYQYGTSPAPYKSNPRLWSTQNIPPPQLGGGGGPRFVEQQTFTERSRREVAMPVQIQEPPRQEAPIIPLRSRSRSPATHSAMSRGGGGRSPLRETTTTTTQRETYTGRRPAAAVPATTYGHTYAGPSSPLPPVLHATGSVGQYRPQPITGRHTTERRVYERRSVSPPASQRAPAIMPRGYSPAARTLERTTVRRETQYGGGPQDDRNGGDNNNNEFDRETIGSYRRAVGGDSRFSSARSSRVATLPVGARSNFNNGDTLRRQQIREQQTTTVIAPQQQRPTSRERPVSAHSRRSTQSGQSFPRQSRLQQPEQPILQPITRTSTTTTTQRIGVGGGGGGGDRSPSTTSSGISSRPPAKEFITKQQQQTISSRSTLPAAAAAGTLRRQTQQQQQAARLQQSGGGGGKGGRVSVPQRIVTRLRVRETQSMEATKIMRLLFAAFNVLVFLCGLEYLLGIGLWILITTWSYLQLSHYLTPYDTLEKLDHPNTVMQNGCYMFIVAGGLLTVLSVIGCIAAFRLNRLLLVIYAILILLILVLEIVAAAYVAWNTPQRTAHEVLRNTLMITFERGYLGDAIVQGQDRTSELNYATFAWNALMRDLRCCGVNGSRDFLFDRLPPGYKANGNVPAACCMLNNTDYWWEPPLPIDRTCQTNPTEFNSWMHRGCYRVFWDFLITKTNIMLGVGIGIGFLLIVGILVSLCLIAAASTEYNERPRAVYTTRTINGKNSR